MRILITGGFGFIGCRLLRFLSHLRQKITVVDNLMYEQYEVPLLFSNCNLEFINEDARKVCDKNFLKEFDFIIHLAAIVGMPACNKNLSLATAINFDLVKQIVDNLNPSQRFFLPVTNSGYGTKSGETYCTEESPLEPISLYGIDKARAEKYTLENFSNSITLRLATLFSISERPRLDLLVNDFAYKAFFENEIVLYQPKFRRNFVHISDVCRCILFCMRRFNDLKGQCYNFGLDSANMSKLELANTIAKYIPCKVTVKDDKEDPDKRDYIVSSEKIYKAGFRPIYSLEAGIKELKNFFKMMPKNKEQREKLAQKMRNV